MGGAGHAGNPEKGHFVPSAILPVGTARTVKMHVELLGIPRERAGVAELEIEAGTLGEAIGVLASRFPRFADLVAAGRLHASIAANLNGDAFVRDPETPLAKHDRLLILSADAGG